MQHSRHLNSLPPLECISLDIASSMAGQNNTLQYCTLVPGNKSFAYFSNSLSASILKHFNKLKYLCTCVSVYPESAHSCLSFHKSRKNLTYRKKSIHVKQNIAKTDLLTYLNNSGVNAKGFYLLLCYLLLYIQ